MKRDLDLLREILLQTESSASSGITASDFVSDDRSAEAVSFHIQLLLDAGYIEAIEFKTLSRLYPDFIIKRITFSGYEYLDSVRSDRVWQETKSRVAKIGSASVDVIKSVASEVIKSMLIG